MIYYLGRAEVLRAGTDACGFAPIVGDEGLLDAAIARPKASAFGEDAYPSILDKAAALMHSLAKNHAFVDGNKRTAWAAAWLMLGVNGIELVDQFDEHEAYDFVVLTATSDIDWRKVSEGLRRYAVHP
ncbi:MAG: type II toxin-antitoxin system death-on-curing family toxin [Gordonia sp.]|uniref:type II toxin-antitoxin system death-on-curing family toxin n=1 Tax=Gordonia sp. (in: high G+C Gram-positive bacteria) TaxID=84139 RepID=UPI001D63D202|nr:type II toxin-antitoxin system death-on-curing family toxin [Gordonia sp. (in: high G+C Gram-positive bacteria)]MCB1295129.1 type II toxin-antitoxin system death-on-curing family toxin [Gordonia sp. (in: high G+C Gram-positive bacteria)]HQV18498.1 type II toxin-antitoxin system death-on-curing family toxin [Gordonia sp. (in: high G+C Gram-positive bacteria)]